MTQEERLDYLLDVLTEEQPSYRPLPVPADPAGKKRLLRALFNTRPPIPADMGLLQVQDAYLQEEIRRRGVTDAAGLPLIRGRFSVWQGDITSLRADAVVNAANSRLLGCFVPGHACIDNAIHTFAGIRLRLACAALMERQGHEEPAGRAKLTAGFNLPCRYVLHTVGPVVSGRPSQEEREALAACYRSCLELADRHGLRSVAFCCISTGIFHFPNEAAAEIAVRTTRDYLRETSSEIKVIFNVFQDMDRRIYRRLLGAD